MYILRKQRLLLLIVAAGIACLSIGYMMSITSNLSVHQLALIGRLPHNHALHALVGRSGWWGQQAYKSRPYTIGNRSYKSGQSAALLTCPSLSRAAIRVPLRSTQRQNLVYTYNTSSNGLLIRYDIKNKKKTTLLTLKNATISNAQLSANGQFILFVTQVNGRLAIQMVRVDGQSLQTLYCAPNSKGPVNFIDDLLWSPDQQRMLFRVPDPAGEKTAPIIQLLNLANGSLQTILAPSGKTGYIPRAWVTTNQVYMQGYALGDSDSVPPHDVYVLDISHKSVRHVASIAGYDWDLSVTPDGKVLLLGQGTALPPQGQPQPPGSISQQATHGSSPHVIYTNHAYGVTQVRAISPQTLLFVLGGRFASGTQNGLWKININGRGLAQLTKNGKLLSDQHTTWSDISRDGHMYAVADYTSTPNSNNGQTTILYGSLHGGPVTTVDTTDVSDNASIVGWTVL